MKLLYKEWAAGVLLLLLAQSLKALDMTSDIPSEKVALGKMLFFDKALSEPTGQSCASCHAPGAANADPFHRSTSPGAHPNLFGNRNSPSISYAKFTPERHYDEEDGTWVGGFFLDGRASSLEEQAKLPLLNPFEMANISEEAIAEKVYARPYAATITRLYGESVWNVPNTLVAAVTDAIAQYERSAEFGLFTSKYDYYLRGEVSLTPKEQRGLNVFEAEDKGNCAACHPSQGVGGEPPLFTDFTYDNLGVPRNKKLPFYFMPRRINPDGFKFVDEGLGNSEHSQATDERGKFKVQTLRNIAVTAPYMHNGVFNNLNKVVDFYNSRDVKAKKWGPPEVAINVNKDELGDLKLTKQEMDDLVAFLKTLTDGYQIPTKNKISR